MEFMKRKALYTYTGGDDFWVNDLEHIIDNEVELYVKLNYEPEQRKQMMDGIFHWIKIATFDDWLEAYGEVAVETTEMTIAEWLELHASTPHISFPLEMMKSIEDFLQVESIINCYIADLIFDADVNFRLNP
jgi:hypothetical protein